MFKLPLYCADIEHISERSNYYIKDCALIHSTSSLFTIHLLTNSFYDFVPIKISENRLIPDGRVKLLQYSIGRHWTMTLFYDVYEK